VSYRVTPRILYLKEYQSSAITCTSTQSVEWYYRHPDLPITTDLSVNPYYSKDKAAQMYPFKKIFNNINMYNQLVDSNTYVLSLSQMDISKRGYYLCFGYDEKGERFVDEVQVHITGKYS